MAKTTAQKIAESQAAFKGRQTQAKITTSQQRKEDRKLTPKRKAEKEAAARSLNVRSQKTAKTQTEREQINAFVPTDTTGKSQEEGATIRKQDQQRKADLIAGFGSSQERAQLGAQSSELRDQAASGFGARTVTTRDGEITRKAPSTPDNGLPTGDQIQNEIGSISTSGATAEQNKAIATVQKFNEIQQQEQDKKNKATQVATAQGTGGSAIEGLPEGTPDFLKSGAGLAEDILGSQLDVAQANQSAKNQLRENQLRQQLGNLSLGDNGENLLASVEGRLGKLSLAQLETLATQNGLELTDDLKNSLSRSGRNAIETEKINRDSRMAENEYSKKQLSRTFDRAITDREQFNTEQDAKMRRLAAQFGGGKYQSLGGNVAVMKSAEKGQRALEDLKGQYTDKTMLVSQRADNIMDVYGNNVRIIEDKMATAQENKLAEIHQTIDDLLEAGVTNEIDLNNSVIKAKQEYAKSYFDIAEKAYTAIESQNQQLFENSLSLRKQKNVEENSERDNRIVNTENGTFVETADGTFVPIESMTEGIQTLDNTRLVTGGASNGAGRNDPTVFMNNINVQGNQLIDSDGNTIARVSSQYGADHSKISGEKVHNGLDVVFPDGKAKATSGGKVIKKGFAPNTYGGFAWVQDGEGNVLQYGHMNVDEINALEVGQAIGAGEVIASQETDPNRWGASSGAHTDIRYVGSGQEEVEGGLYNKFIERAKTEGVTNKKAQKEFAEKRLEASFKDFTDFQGKAYDAYTKIVPENERYSSLVENFNDKELEDFADDVNFITKKIKDDGLTSEIINNNIKDPAIRQAIMSEMRWIEGKLRKESGAAISAEEYQSNGTMYFPRKGDDENEIKFKAQRRKAIETGLFGQIGARGERLIEEGQQTVQDQQEPDVEQLKIQHPNKIFVEDENGDRQVLDSEDDILPTDTRL